MHVISHRGAKGHGDENSLNSIKIAADLKVDFIEFDIRYTKNNVIVLQHDAETPKGKAVKDYTYKTLQREISYMPTLREAMREAKGKPVIIESKAEGTLAKSIDIIKRHPKSVIASKIPEEVLSARINLPKHNTYFIKGPTPFRVISIAKQINSTGISINKNWLPWVPYYYILARKNKLDMYVYTVNNYYLAKVLTFLMPKLYIVTDYPKKMLEEDE